MSSSTVQTFAELDLYHAAIRARRIEGVVTARGAFRAKLTRVDFDRLLMQRADESLPRVLSMANTPQRLAVIFATDQGRAGMQVSGLPLTPGELIAWDSGLMGHHRSAAGGRWGSMSLARDDLAA
jgi:hypothetical protein